jgi:hypothetical protein
MTRRIVSAIVNALKTEWTQDEVHFHTNTGRPYPCFDDRCTRPRFDAD